MKFPLAHRLVSGLSLSPTLVPSFSTRLFPLVGLAFLCAAVAASADPAALKDARTALESLSAQNRAASTVSLAFTSRVMGADGSWMPSVKGSLVTADSGRFRLRHAQGTVVSDGNTVWQYFPSTKQVVIRGANGGNAGGGAGGVLLRFLQARALDAGRVSGALRIALDPASVGENLDSLVLTLSADASTVRRVETQDPAGNRAEYVVTSLHYDARPGRGAFEFKIPPGAEIVDMR